MIPLAFLQHLWPPSPIHNEIGSKNSSWIYKYEWNSIVESVYEYLRALEYGAMKRSNCQTALLNTMAISIRNGILLSRQRSWDSIRH